MKPTQDFLRKWDMLADTATGLPARLAVVGGGAAGVELLLAMQYRWGRAAQPSAVRFLLATDSDQLLAGHAPAARAMVARVLQERKIGIHYNSRVSRVEPGAMITVSGQRIEADAIIWTTGAAAPPLLRQTGLALDAAGFIAINAQLQSIGHPEVFAAGDCATIEGKDYPKSGVYAVRQGPLLAENLQRALAGAPLLTYRPQRRALALISTGDRHAIASYGKHALAGRWIWRWKNHIDRGFVAKYNSLPFEPA